MNNQYDQYTEQELIHKILDGASALYETLIRKYNPFLYKIGRTYRYNHQDTEDLMQETFISAFVNLKKFENRSSFNTWITRIMLNHCYQKKQKLSYKNEVKIDSDLTEKNIPMFQNHSNTEKAVLNKELGLVLENALNEVPEDYRIVFTLRKLNGLSVSETAEAMNITEANVKVRLNRANAMLRNEIEKMYSPEDIYEFNLVYCDSIVERVMTRIENLKLDLPNE